MIPIIHIQEQIIRTDFNDKDCSLRANTTLISLSMVIVNNMRTDTSLESIESEPANWQRFPFLHATSCLKYLPFHWRSLMAMINRYTPIKKSAQAKLVSTKDWTLLSSRTRILQMITNKLPMKASNPRIQIHMRSPSFFIKSSQVENALSGDWHLRFGMVLTA